MPTGEDLVCHPVKGKESRRSHRREVVGKAQKRGQCESSHMLAWCWDGEREAVMTVHGRR